MTISTSQDVPSPRQCSRFKIWLRTGILAVFGTLFGLTLAHDIAAGRFTWFWGLAIFLACLPVGFALRRLVPMQVHRASQHITLSFDRLYFALILALVIAKAITGKVSGLGAWSDAIMCAILGIMSGRLSGICLRVRGLKVQHQFLNAAQG